MEDKIRTLADDLKEGGYKDNFYVRSDGGRVYEIITIDHNGLMIVKNYSSEGITHGESMMTPVLDWWLFDRRAPQDIVDKILTQRKE